jgi:hypothetical protein
MKWPFGGKKLSFCAMKSAFGAMKLPFGGKNLSSCAMKLSLSRKNFSFGRKARTFAGMKFSFGRKARAFAGMKFSFGAKGDFIGAKSRGICGRMEFGVRSEDLTPRRPGDLAFRPDPAFAAPSPSGGPPPAPDR